MTVRLCLVCLDVHLYTYLHLHMNTHAHSHTVVSVGLNSTEHMVSEDVQSVSICAVLRGEADFQIQASLRTVDGTAKGKHFTTSLSYLVTAESNVDSFHD